MKLTINAKELTTAITELKRYATSKTIPVLQCCMLTADGDTVSLTATDLECAVILRLNADVTESGSAVIPITPFAAVTKGCKGELSLEYSENQLTVAGATIPTEFTPFAFPELPTFVEKCEHSNAWPAAIPVSSLKALITRTAPCISTEVGRFTLNGALFIGNESGLRMVATDGHRLAVADEPGWYAPFRFLVPAFALRELAKLKAVSVEFSADEKFLYFETPARTIIAQKLTGNFPDYERVMPRADATPNVLTVSRRQLLGASERVYNLNRKERLPSMMLHVNGSTFVQSRGNITFTEPLQSACYTGADIEIGLNSAYIVDAMKSATSETLEVRLQDAKSAMVICEPGFQYVVMPVRL